MLHTNYFPYTDDLIVMMAILQWTHDEEDCVFVLFICIGNI